MEIDLRVRAGEPRPLSEREHERRERQKERDRPAAERGHATES